MLRFLALLFGLVRGAHRSRADLVAENLLLRQQLAVLTRPGRRQARLRPRDKLFWVLVRWLRRDWRRHLVLVRPETVVGWRRKGWRLVSRRRSGGRPGRPRLDAEVQALIARLARENPAWGSERIRGELLKLGIVVSKRSVQRYRGRGPARPPSQTWRTFLANHAGQLRAADASVVADAEVAALLGAAVRHPPAGCSPASGRDGDLDRSAPASAARSDAAGTAIMLPAPCLREQVRPITDVGGPPAAAATRASTRGERQPRAREWDRSAGRPGPPDERRRAPPPLGPGHARGDLYPGAPRRALDAELARPVARSPTGPTRAGRARGGPQRAYQLAA